MPAGGKGPFSLMPVSEAKRTFLVLFMSSRSCVRAWCARPRACLISLFARQLSHVFLLFLYRLSLFLSCFILFHDLGASWFWEARREKIPGGGQRSAARGGGHPIGAGQALEDPQHHQRRHPGGRARAAEEGKCMPYSTAHTAPPGPIFKPQVLRPPQQEECQSRNGRIRCSAVYAHHDITFPGRTFKA